ncbi:MAG TPA: hypothetical protein PLV92_28120, partial [Pirellulaceae bacterium]|nr:hypothetical protein [Pirellulaceae bacterium]
ITLTKKMVASVVVRSEAERRYEELLPKMPQTVDGHWKMAEWCKERGLDALRENHLREILKLEPDHEAARLGLGYTRVRGKWTTVEEFYKSQGYVRHGLTWRLPQELAMLTAQEKARRDEIEWRQKIKILRSKVERRGGDRALEELRGIREPAAAPAIVSLLEDKNESRDMKMMYIEVLTQIDSGVAASAIMRHAIENDDDGIRDKCLDQLEKFKSPQMTTYFVRRLKDDNNVVINRAAIALSRLRDSDATLPLIDVLVTKHKQTVMPGGSPGSITPTFSSDGGAGLQMGGSPKTIQFDVKNDGVLTALIATHPGVNYQFDKAAWKRWYAEVNTPRVVDLRRDN